MFLETAWQLKAAGCEVRPLPFTPLLRPLNFLRFDLLTSNALANANVQVTGGGGTQASVGPQ
jgi:hypothetical protein